MRSPLEAGGNIDFGRFFLKADTGSDGGSGTTPIHKARGFENLFAVPSSSPPPDINIGGEQGSCAQGPAHLAEGFEALVQDVSSPQSPDMSVGGVADISDITKFPPDVQDVGQYYRDRAVGRVPAPAQTPDPEAATRAKEQAERAAEIRANTRSSSSNRPERTETHEKPISKLKKALANLLQRAHRRQTIEQPVQDTPRQPREKHPEKAKLMGKETLKSWKDIDRLASLGGGVLLGGGIALAKYMGADVSNILTIVNYLKTGAGALVSSGILTGLEMYATVHGHEKTARALNIVARVASDAAIAAVGATAGDLLVQGTFAAAEKLGDLAVRSKPSRAPETVSTSPPQTPQEPTETPIQTVMAKIKETLGINQPSETPTPTSEPTNTPTHAPVPAESATATPTSQAINSKDDTYAQPVIRGSEPDTGGQPPSSTDWVPEQQQFEPDTAAKDAIAARGDMTYQTPEPHVGTIGSTPPDSGVKITSAVPETSSVQNLSIANHPVTAATGETVQIINDKLHYGSNVWDILGNGLNHIGNLLNINLNPGQQDILQQKLNYAADLWAHGNLADNSDLGKIFHYCNGTESMIGEISAGDLQSALENEGIFVK